MADATTTTEREREVIPVLDPTGKVAEWLTTGRGVAVWRCIAMDSSRLGAYTFTPHDNGTDASHKPSWRDEYQFSVTDPNSQQFVFYKRAGVEARWTDTPQGWRAAYRKAEESEYGDTERDAPIGRVYDTCTIERLTYQTDERVPYPLYTGDDAAEHSRPLDTFFAVGIVRWSALVPSRDDEERTNGAR